MSTKKITGIILAGGKSTRMGSKKALLLYNNQRLIDIAVSIIAPLVNDLLISSNEPIADIKYRVVPDLVQNIGPIGGLYTCMKESKNSLHLVIPCDVPLVSTSFYKSMLLKSNSFDAVIPCHENGKLEPLLGVYHKNVVPVMDEQINNRNFKMVSLLDRLKVLYIDVPKSEDLKNMNYQTDLV